jgi:hypothetical protein
MAQHEIMWGRVALVVVIVAVAAGVFVLLRRGGVQSQTLLAWSNSSYMILENTGDDLPIENIFMYAPFPDKFENLYLYEYGFGTTDNGTVVVRDGDVLENTLVGRKPPTFAIEETAFGKRAVIRVERMYVGDVISVTWRFSAPENTSLYDANAENRCKIYVSYNPTETIKLRVGLGLYRIESNSGISWRHYIYGPGWLDAPSESV